MFYERRKGEEMLIVTCNCKKQFVVDIPPKDFEITGDPKKTFLVAKCPECLRLTRFSPEETKEIERGTYAGIMETKSE